jgi:hypothetical protein
MMNNCHCLGVVALVAQTILSCSPYDRRPPANPRVTLREIHAHAPRSTVEVRGRAERWWFDFVECGSRAQLRVHEVVVLSEDGRELKCEQRFGEGATSWAYGELAYTCQPLDPGSKYKMMLSGEARGYVWIETAANGFVSVIRECE